MAQQMGPAVGFQSMLKEGTRYLSGLDEAVLKNIEACKEIASKLRTSLGPNGMNKMVINHLDKLFVTSDAATILNELEVQHPAAKLVIMAAKAQQEEIGDGTNFVIAFAGELLKKAEELIHIGLHVSDIVEGYEKAGAKAQAIVEELETFKCENVQDREQLALAVRSAIASKQFGFETQISKLVADACLRVMPEKPSQFNVDNVRVSKIPGGSVHDSHVINGSVVLRGCSGSITSAKNCKVAVLGNGLDSEEPETQGKVVMENASELLSYTASEEAHMEKLVGDLKSAGVGLVISGAKLSDTAIHFLDRADIMAIRIVSKFEMRRLTRLVGAVNVVRTVSPEPAELGHIVEAGVQEIGGRDVIVLRQDGEKNPISTIILRAATQNILDDLERAVNDGVNIAKWTMRDGRFVSGAGASEIELARRVQAFGDAAPGLDQYAIKKFAEAFEIIPKTLAENAGMNSADLVSTLYSEHAGGNSDAGVDVEELGTCDARKANIFDHLHAKSFAIKYATHAVTTLLRVDQIIMAKVAGGPAPPRQ